MHSSLPTRSAAQARPRILLVGATGQVGYELLRTLQPLCEVIATGRPRDSRPLPSLVPLDLSDPDAVRETVRRVAPQLIVSAAAYTAVDRAEQEHDLAMAVNAAAPAILAEEARRAGAAIVHFSTDYVFDGSGTRPWREEDPTGPLNAYGRSKLAGEEAIRASGVAHLILRTSWVYAARGRNFVRTMLRLGQERPELRVVADQHGAPTSARMIADVTGQVLAQAGGDFTGFLSERGGTVHLCCQGETTWHGFASATFELWRERGLPLAVQKVVPIHTEEYPTPARRPTNSRLDCGRLRERFGLSPPGWREALALCVEEMASPSLEYRLQAADAGAALGDEKCPPKGGTPTVPDLEIGVIYTHERYFMPRLLSSLARSGDDLSLRLIAVDNASSDWNPGWERICDTKLLKNSRRITYAANLNLILQSSSAPLVLLLNTDMSLDPEEQCLSKMVRFMDEHPRCGVSGCRLYHPDGTYAFPARRFQKLRTIAARRTPLSPLLRKSVDHYLYRDRDEQGVFECQWLSGCFLLVRRQAYLEVGGFDDAFQKYFEDVDFCLRMARAGWQVMFNGATYCYHYEQRASKNIYGPDAWRHLRSYVRWLRKWGFAPEKATAERREGARRAG
jgi:dTDP-4-dehydrorhamnose reductase